MIFGIVSAVLLFAECMRFFIKKKKRLIPHKVCGFLLLAVSGVHFVSVLALWRQRPLLMDVLGCAMFAVILAACLCVLFKRKRRKLHKFLTVTALVILGVHIFLGISSLSDYQQRVSEIKIENVDVSAIPDGKHEGQYSVGYVFARVSVSVSDGKITDVEILEHGTERGKAAETITDTIVAEQRVDVDVVTTATNSSKVIEKAVENALKGAVK